MLKFAISHGATCTVNALLLLMLCSGLRAAAPEEAAPAKQIPTPRPPMGWNSWNSFSNSINSKIVVEQAKAIVASGMKDAGYRYVSIDEGWWLGERDRNGNITVDPKQWPAIAPGEKDGDMTNIVTYLHGMGLKAGIYTDAGAYGCSYASPDIGPPWPHTGSYGHYNQDFSQFAKWGFDYVKVDWCGGDKPNLDPAVQYAEIARAITNAEAKTGHHLYLSICDWGRQSPWTWAPGIGNLPAAMWRTSGDIVGPIVADAMHANRSATLKNVFSNFDRGMHPEAQHTGYYNDLDMMVLGMRGMSETADRVHMSLWAISGAPMIVGADITKLSKADLAILTNRDVIAVQQDSLGLQCVKVAEPPATGLQVWAKPLSQSGQRAVVLLNRTESSAPITVRWNELGLAPSTAASVRDLWTQKDLGRQASSYTATVPANDAVMLVIQGSEGKAARYQAGSWSETGNERSLTFSNVAAMGQIGYLQIAYTNGEKTPIVAELRVNGQDATKVAFPSTGGGKAVGTVTVMTDLNSSGKTNTVAFSAPCRNGLALDSISVSSW